MGTKEQVGEKVAQKPGGQHEAGITITLREGEMPDPPVAKASKHTATGGTPDKVRWHNLTDKARTIRFKSGWPFVPPTVDIVVPAHGYSAWYYVSPTVADKAYPYGVSPDPMDGNGPDDPKVSVSG